jgi:hypothetical protein
LASDKPADDSVKKMLEEVVQSHFDVIQTSVNNLYNGVELMERKFNQKLDMVLGGSEKGVTLIHSSR